MSRLILTWVFQDEDSDAQYRSASQGSSELEFLSDSPTPPSPDNDLEECDLLRPAAPSPHTQDSDISKQLRPATQSVDSLPGEQLRTGVLTPGTADLELSGQFSPGASSPETLEPELPKQLRPGRSSPQSPDSELFEQFRPSAPSPHTPDSELLEQFRPSISRPETTERELLEQLTPGGPSPHTPDSELLEIFRPSSLSPHIPDPELLEQLRPVPSRISDPEPLEQPEPASTIHHSSDADVSLELTATSSSVSENKRYKTLDNMSNLADDRDKTTQGNTVTDDSMECTGDIHDTIVPVQRENNGKLVGEEITLKLKTLEQGELSSDKPLILSGRDSGTQSMSEKLSESVVEDVVEPSRTLARPPIFPTSTPKDTPPMALSPPVPPSVSTVDAESSMVESVIDDSLDDTDNMLRDPTDILKSDTVTAPHREESTLKGNAGDDLDEYVVIDDVLEAETRSSGSGSLNSRTLGTTDNMYQIKPVQPRGDDLEAETRSSGSDSLNSRTLGTTDNMYQIKPVQPRHDDLDLVTVTKVREILIHMHSFPCYSSPYATGFCDYLRTKNPYLVYFRISQVLLLRILANIRVSKVVWPAFKNLR